MAPAASAGSITMPTGGWGALVHPPTQGNINVAGAALVVQAAPTAIACTVTPDALTIAAVTLMLRIDTTGDRAT